MCYRRQKGGNCLTLSTSMKMPLSSYSDSASGTKKRSGALRRNFRRSANGCRSLIKALYKGEFRSASFDRGVGAVGGELSMHG